ncbi:TonB-dependent receptor [Govanella unica]|uniref:TonB-dependent receptor n=1 Tax=Govanella unica TaxID=2975056 RepID=A0A9X3TZT0_9PROT|nr:TonB-dependent receptor [Govania unica]MDA5194424.1 TonB-dependent receptor [Govania unica]
MGLKLSRSTSGSLLALMLMPALGQGALAQTRSGQSADNLRLEEIIVTAERREASLQTIPLAISAIDPAMMERRQITDTRQIVFNVPNLTGNNNVGQQTAITFFIRGIGTTESLASVDTSVGVYIDDVYVARQGVNNFNLFDVERIEVLRGPQGTLYGRNTNGGAVKIVTKKPNNEPELTARASYGNYNRWELKASGNAPIVEDKLFVRAGVLTQQGDGYAHNLTLNKDVNDLDYLGARAAVRVLPSESLDYTLAFDWGRDKQNGMYASDILGRVRPRTSSLFDVLSGENIRNKAKTWGISGNGIWHINDSLNLESITGYRYTRQIYNLDITDQPQPLYILHTDTESKQFSQELKLAGKVTDRLNFVAGVYYFHETSDVYLGDELHVYRNLNNLSAGRLDLFYRKYMDIKTDSYAAFGQVDYAVTDSVSVVLGGRYTIDKKSMDVRQTINGAPTGFTNATLQGLINSEGLSLDLDPVYKKFTPKIGINWQVNDDVFAYASFTQGFRSGGWQARVNNARQFQSFDPETVNSYEVGTKMSLFGGQARWNSSVFYMKYKDLFNSVPGAGNTFLIATADADIYGLESEVTLRVTDWLDLFGNIGLLHSKYTKKPGGDILGAELQRAPKVQAKAGFSVNYPLADMGSLLVNGDVFYTSSYYTNPQDELIGKTGDFALVNASIGYRTANERYEISLSCTNCLNKEYFDSILSFPASGFTAVYTGSPRFYKVTGSVRF